MGLWSLVSAMLFGFLFAAPVSDAQNVPENSSLPNAVTTATPVLNYPPPGYIQIISLRDGSTLVGRITLLSVNSISFSTEIGTVEIPYTKIQGIRTVPESSMQQGEYRFPDPNLSRLYYAPTGRMLPKGAGYIADYYLFFPTVNYGVSERFSFGGGISILPTGSMHDQIYYITPKFGIKQSEHFNLAAGALVIKIPVDKDVPLISVLYGVGTWGGADRSFTAAFGYGMVDKKMADRPMIVLGGEQRITRRFAFVSENWMMPGIDNALVSYGIRFITEKFTTDFAFLNPTSREAIFPGIPYIDFMYYF